MIKENCKSPCLCDTCLTARGVELKRLRDNIKEKIEILLDTSYDSPEYRRALKELKIVL